jgi:hypothetical protein
MARQEGDPRLFQEVRCRGKDSVCREALANPLFLLVAAPALEVRGAAVRRRRRQRQGRAAEARAAVGCELMRGRPRRDPHDPRHDRGAARSRRKGERPRTQRAERAYGRGAELSARSGAASRPRRRRPGLPHLAGHLAAEHGADRGQLRRRRGLDRRRRSPERGSREQAACGQEERRAAGGVGEAGETKIAPFVAQCPVAPSAAHAGSPAAAPGAPAADRRSSPAGEPVSQGLAAGASPMPAAAGTYWPFPA